MKAFFILLLLLGFSFCGWTQSNQVKNGFLDLRSEVFDDSNIIPLKGDWQFVNRAFLTDRQMLSYKNPHFGAVPGEWNYIDWQGQKVGGHSFGTYQMRILLPKNLKTLALHLPTQGTAFRVFANGKLLKEVGKVGQNKASTQARYENYTHIFSEIPDTLTLTLHIANFDYRKGGMWHEPFIGTQKAIFTWREWVIAAEFFLFGSVFLMAIYHLSLYVYRPDYQATLFFGLVCICTVLREGAIGDLLWVKLFPQMPWEMLVKIEYISLFVGFLMSFWFMRFLFPKETHRIVAILLNIIIGSFVVFTLIFPASISSYIVLAFQLLFFVFVFYACWAMLQAIRHRRNGALIFSGGMIFLFLSGLNDILYYNYLISTGAVMTFGLFLYFFSQVMILSRRFSSAFTENEKLSKELKEINNHLEEKIKERTGQLNESIEELNQSNQQLSETLKTLNQQKEHLEELNREKDGIVGVVAHDLRAPFNRQKGLLSLVNLTGELNEEQKSFLEMMEKNCEQGLNLIRDLLVINNAESEQSFPAFEPLDIAAFLKEICQEFEALAQSKQIKIKLQIPDYELVINTDSDFLRRILENLISNAIKFSYPQKNIFIQLNDNTETWELSIRDEGQGIAENELPKLFKKFQKLSARPTAGEDSSGLGLAIVKSLVEKLQGAIEVKSKVNEGTNFLLQFPKNQSLAN